MADVMMYDGGTRFQIVACEGANWMPSEWRAACGAYAASLRRRNYVIPKHIDFGSDYMVGAMKWANDPSGAWPAALGIGTHFLLPGSRIKDIVLKNCVAVEATMDISLIGNFGNVPAANVDEQDLDTQTDANVPAGTFPGSTTTTIAVATGLDLATVGHWAFSRNDFTQDEALVVVKLTPKTGTVINVGCFTLFVEVTDFDDVCDCVCPIAPCVSEFPPTIDCWPNY